jgi:hypothetical protein
MYFSFGSARHCAASEKRVHYRGHFAQRFHDVGEKMVCRACGYRMLSGPLADGPFLQLFMMKRVKHFCGSFVHLASSEENILKHG